jgi:hypothetical protein
MIESSVESGRLDDVKRKELKKVLGTLESQRELDRFADRERACIARRSWDPGRVRPDVRQGDLGWQGRAS